jgi:hypothetical protein
MHGPASDQTDVIGASFSSVAGRDGVMPRFPELIDPVPPVHIADAATPAVTRMKDEELVAACSVSAA